MGYIGSDSSELYNNKYTHIPDKKLENLRATTRTKDHKRDIRRVL